MHEVLVNGLGGLSLPRKSVVRSTDRPDMTLDVYRGRKTTIQQQTLTTHQKAFIFEPWVPERVSFYAMSLAPGFMPRGGAKGQNLGHC